MSDLDAVSVVAGDSPVVLGMPHVGTDIPPNIFERLNPLGQQLSDTDWHIDRLYDGLLADATVVKAVFHRYVIDANRDPAQISLYPGQNTTSLCPETDFDGRSVWLPNQQPNATDIEYRLQHYHVPYHRALQAQLNRVKALHGIAVLFDCHSIRSVVPYLFEGQLPVFNVGSNDGLSCDESISTAVTTMLGGDSRFDMVVNGRFKGGYSTRHYGRPSDGQHAIQLEMSQRVYMTEQHPWPYDEALAEQVRPTLAKALTELANSVGRS